MGYEEDAKELMRRFKLQHQQSMKNVGIDPANEKLNEILNRSNISNSSSDVSNIMNTQQSLDFSESTEQGPYQEKLTDGGKTQVISFTPQTAPSTNVPLVGNICSQCKTLHPPLRPGEQCPNKAIDLSAQGLDETSINKFIVDIRNMVVSQMNLKNIKDGKKFFQHSIIELMKILEGYNE